MLCVLSLDNLPPQSGDVWRESQFHHVSSLWRSLWLLASQLRLWHRQSFTPLRQPRHRLLCRLHVSVGWGYVRVRVHMCVCVCVSRWAEHEAAHSYLMNPFTSRASLAESNMLKFKKVNKCRKTEEKRKLMNSNIGFAAQTLSCLNVNCVFIYSDA